ncbi:MAG: rod shape-determining protein [Gammaproteobacteria bacterium]|nr:rod shape-determining protein [Gammaproteobacteria bacterium]
MFKSIVRRLNSEISIDLGTANTIVSIKDVGIVVEQPSVIAVSENPRQIVAVGSQAKQLIGRAPPNVRVIRPLRDGQISEPEYASKMLELFLRMARTAGSAWLGRRPIMLICLPSNSSGIEKRAIREAGHAVGAKEVHLIEEPLAAAVGSGLDVEKPQGNLLVDIGGGTTDVAVISLGQIVESKSVRVAGDVFDQAIINYVSEKYRCKIGEATAEYIKTNIGTVIEETTETFVDIRAQNIAQNVPQRFSLSSAEILAPLTTGAKLICGAVKETMERCPPELASDIAGLGMMMTGGGALLRGMDTLISKETGLHVTIAENPLQCVAKGCEIVLSKRLSGMFLPE